MIEKQKVSLKQSLKTLVLTCFLTKRSTSAQTSDSEGWVPESWRNYGYDAHPSQPKCVTANPVRMFSLLIGHISVGEEQQK